MYVAIYKLRISRLTIVSYEAKKKHQPLSQLFARNTIKKLKSSIQAAVTAIA